MKLITLLFLPILLSSMMVYGQAGGIKGNVTTSEGKAAEFVNVALQGTTLGSVTDKAGNFEIAKVPAGTYTAVFSLMGSTKFEQRITVKTGEVSRLEVVMKNSSVNLNEVTVEDKRLNPYYKDNSSTVSKMPLKDLENPQVYNSISGELLEDQVVTNFNDALKNATGVSRLWESTGRGGDGAEFYSMRGFAVQPTMVNGMPSVTNGGLDPSNVENIEVIKGPSGTLFGSPLISYGGLINITTKKPYETFGGQAGFVHGTNNLNRFTADVNVPLSENTAARVNAAYHSENTFQDAGFTRSFFVAPSLTLKPAKKLTFIINTEFLSRESANVPMIFLNRYAPLTFNDMTLFEKNYEKSFTSDDLTIKNPMFGFQVQALYELSKAWTSQTVFSGSNTKSDGYYHYLWDLSDGNSFVRYISKRNGETNTTDIQQNFIGDFKFGNMRNRIIVGADYYSSNINNSSTGWVENGTVTLQDGADTGVLTQAGVDNLLIDSFEGNSTGKTETISGYVSDVIDLTSYLSVMASVRFDYFKGQTAYWSTEEVKGESAISPKLGIVYQPVKDKVSVFANYMNGFVYVTPAEVSDIDGSNPHLKTFDPEHANQYEVGVKSSLLKNKVSVTASYYNILVKDRVMSDPNNINNSIQGGEVESNGFELSVIANPVTGLNVVAGFSHNNSEVTKDNPGDGYLGMRPEEAGPEWLANYWLSYTFQGNSINGFGIGIGGNSAAEHKTLNRSTTGTFTLPSYTILNAVISYTQPRYSLMVKANNIADQEYYTGWSTVTPQNLRNYSVSLNYKF